MEPELFNIKSSQNDIHEWNNIPYKESDTGLYLPQSKVISLHSGWSDMHFHYFDRAKYTMFLNLYQIYAARHTDAQSDGKTIEFSVVLINNIINQLRGYESIKIFQDYFNITYLPFVDSRTEFEKGQFYCSLDIHLKEQFINELRIDFPLVMEPFLNSVIKNEQKRLFPLHQPSTLFMDDLYKAIITSLKKGPQYLPLVDKDVEALIAHAVAYNMDVNVPKLNTQRLVLMNEVYNKIIEDPSKFAGIKELRQLAHTNSTTLNNMFKETFNITMKQCWIRYRMDRALFMVVHERDKLITDIADLLGFSCLENFSKAFKATYMQSPIDFRSNNIDFDSLFQVNL